MSVIIELQDNEVVMTKLEGADEYIAFGPQINDCVDKDDFIFEIKKQLKVDADSQDILGLYFSPSELKALLRVIGDEG